MEPMRPQGPQRATPGPAPMASIPQPVPDFVRPEPVRDVGAGRGRLEGASGPEAGDGAGESRPAKPGAGKLAVAALAVVVTVVAFFAMRGPVPLTDDARSPNWERIQQVTKANEGVASGSTNKVMKVNLGGGGEILGGVALTATDEDQKTTDAVKRAMAGAGNDAAAAAAGMNEIQKAQVVPEPPTPESKQALAAAQADPEATPQLSTGMVDAIQNGDGKFYHIYMFDNCFQDGDIVRIWIDSKPFAVVPITNQGATLSVPMSTTNSYSVVIEGVFDGGGGITVACKTSDGTYFTKVMVPHEKQQLAFVAPGK